jgi:hypothetical protein
LSTRRRTLTRTIFPSRRMIEATNDAKLEGVICIIRDSALVAICRKNGSNEFYKVSKMGFDDIAELFGADLVKPIAGHTTAG